VVVLYTLSVICCPAFSFARIDLQVTFWQNDENAKLSLTIGYTFHDSVFGTKCKRLLMPWFRRRTVLFLLCTLASCNTLLQVQATMSCLEFEIVSVRQVTCEGQIIGGILAETRSQAQRAAKAVRVTYEDLKPIITIEVRNLVVLCSILIGRKHRLYTALSLSKVKRPTRCTIDRSLFVKRMQSVINSAARLVNSVFYYDRITPLLTQLRQI